MARPRKIPRNLLGALRELDMEGRSSTQIQAWLFENHRISVNDDTILRYIHKVRVVPPVDAPGLTDLLLAVRSSLRADLLSTDWRQSTRRPACSSRSTRSSPPSAGLRPAWPSSTPHLQRPTR